MAVVVSLATYKRNDEVDDEFTRTGSMVALGNAGKAHAAATKVSEAAAADRNVLP